MLLVTDRAKVILFSFGLAAALLAHPSLAASQSGTVEPLRSKEEVLATVNGKAVLKADVDKKIESELYGVQSKIYSLEEQVYLLRLRTVERMIEDVVLEDEARARGVSVGALKKSLVPDNLTVSQAEVDRFYDENRAIFGSVTTQEAKTGIRATLETKAKQQRYRVAVAELRNKWGARILFPAPSAPLLNLEDSGPSRGPRSAPVRIVEFGDFQCPFCRLAEHVLEQVVGSYGDQVRLTYKHLPLPSHPQAFIAAQASVCAGEQARFWEYHDLLFKGGEDISRAALERRAMEIGLDPGGFSNCMDSQASRNVVIADITEAENADIQATPTFFVNGRIFRGAISFEEFKKAIDREIESGRPRGKPESKGNGAVNPSGGTSSHSK